MILCSNLIPLGAKEETGHRFENQATPEKPGNQYGYYWPELDKNGLMGHNIGWTVS